MQVYLENLFNQLFAYDHVTVAHVVEKYHRVLLCSGVQDRHTSSSSRHKNALNEIRQLFSPCGIALEEYLQQLVIYEEAQKLLDTYASDKRIEDFEEIAFVLTIIINYPNIIKAQTRY